LMVLNYILMWKEGIEWTTRSHTCTSKFPNLQRTHIAQFTAMVVHLHFVSKQRGEIRDLSKVYEPNWCSL
jgi:hypothetical protein